MIYFRLNCCPIGNVFKIHWTKLPKTKAVLNWHHCYIISVKITLFLERYRLLINMHLHQWIENFPCEFEWRTIFPPGKQCPEQNVLSARKIIFYLMIIFFKCNEFSTLETFIEIKHVLSLESNHFWRSHKICGR